MLGLALLARVALTVNAAAIAPAHNGKVIVRLVSRHSEIHAVSTGDGVRYSATDKSGRILTANATLDELRQQHPALYRQLTPAVSVSTKDAAAGAVPFAGLSGGYAGE